MSIRNLPSVARALVSFCVVFSLGGCGKKDETSSGANAKSSQQSSPSAEKSSGGANRGNRPQPVTTTLTRLETVPITLEAQGNVIALDEVEVRPQKNGTIKEIHFREGEEVQRGQLLFTLDDRDDAANVQRAEANVTGAQAALTAAQRDFQRTQDLSARNFVSPSALDTSRSKVDAADATLAQNKAALDQARVSMSYTRIRAPQDGRAGRVEFRPGSLVTSSSAAMVKITRMNPIGVSFVLPERDLPGLLTAQRTGAVKVQVDIDNQHSQRGEVVFVDSSVDRTSGTIGIKARVDNKERRVWPGQYVTVKIVAGESKNAVVLPAQAVINGPNGRLVYVVKEDQTVAPQPVELLRIVDEKAIVKGINSGVKVVLEGGQNLRPGVAIQEMKSAGGENKSRGKHGDNQSGPKANNAAEKVAEKQPSNTAKTVVIPDGFKPRDPEAWAAMSDEQRAAIIARWRERQAEGGVPRP